MTDIESIIDRRIDRAAEYYKGSELSVKYVAIIAGNVVGTYGEGATQAIADKIQRSVASVQDYAHAYWLYSRLRECSLSQTERRHVRRLWRTLTFSHWRQAYDVIEPHRQSFKYLYFADEHRWSGSRMVKEFRADYEAQYGAPPPVTPDKHLQRARGIVEHILVNMDSFDAAIVEWARMGLNLIGGRET